MVGKVHQSTTSGEIQEFRVLEANPQGLHSYHKLAISILRHTLQEASYVFVHTNGRLTREKSIHMATSRQALAFVMGTGLDIMLQSYGMDYNPEDLREQFYAIFHFKNSP